MKADKKTAIEKAYGEHWDAVKIFTDMSTGWCNHPNSEFGRLGLSPEDKERFKIIHNIAKKEDWQNDQFYFRPKSLKGIENNNGWQKIESDEDLPKDDGWHWINYHGDTFVCYFSSNKGMFVDNDNQYYLRNVTHYKLIEEPNPPIY